MVSKPGRIPLVVFSIDVGFDKDRDLASQITFNGEEADNAGIEHETLTKLLQDAVQVYKIVKAYFENPSTEDLKELIESEVVDGKQS